MLEMPETHRLIEEELEALRRRPECQEKSKIWLTRKLERERLLAKLHSWERLDKTMGLELPGGRLQVCG